MTPDQSRWNLDIHRRVVRMECILNAMDEYQEPLTLWKRISRWWNRSRNRALKHQLSELRKRIMKQEEAVSKLTTVQANHATAIGKLIDGQAVISTLKAEIVSLKEAAANADLPEGVSSLIDGLVTSSADVANRSTDIANAGKPIEPPPAG